MTSHNSELWLLRMYIGYVYTSLGATIGDLLVDCIVSYLIIFEKVPKSLLRLDCLDIVGDYLTSRPLILSICGPIFFS